MRRLGFGSCLGVVIAGVLGATVNHTATASPPPPPPSPTPTVRPPMPSPVPHNVLPPVPHPRVRAPWRAPFPNASFEEPDVSGYSIAFVGSRPLPPDARKTAQRSATPLQSDAIRINGQPPATLGGDYWKVPFPANTNDIGQTGDYWAQTAGVLITPAFELDAGDNYLSFLMKTSGHGSVDVSIIGPDSAELTSKHFDGVSIGRMHRLVIPLGTIPAAKRHNVRVMVPMQTSDAVDDFVLTTNDPIPMFGAGGGAMNGQLTPAGVWGMADLHAHFFNHMGFGGRMLAGTLHSSIGRKGLGSDLYGGYADPNAMRTRPSDPGQALPDCHPVHGQAPPPASSDGVETILPEGGHSADGYPKFTSWPRYSSTSHQQAYVDWIKRAWQGGLRLVHVDVGNEALVGKAIDTIEPKIPIVGFNARGPANAYDDASSIRLQVQAMKDFATLPDVAPWAEIAYTPADARRIIGQGKLAMILGVEVEDMCPDARDPNAFQSCVDDLYGMGIRHVIPIHTTNNYVGGAAAYDMRLFLGQAAARGRIFDMTNGFGAGVRARPDLDEKDLESARNFAIGNFHPFDEFVRDVAGQNAIDIMNQYRALAQTYQGQSQVGLVNALGLTDAGKNVMQRMMQAGFVIDMDHMSDRSINDTIALAQRFQYPVIFSHTGFRDLSFGTSKTSGGATQTDRFGIVKVNVPNYDTQFNGPNSPLGTDDAEKMASERDHTRAQVDAVRQLGGMVGVGTGGGAIPHPFRSPDDPTFAACDGASPTFVSEYLYAVQEMGGHGIAIGTDINGLNGMAGPRFGPFACWAAAGDGQRDKFLDKMAYGQRAPVRYRSNTVRNYGDPRFTPPEPSDLDKLLGAHSPAVRAYSADEQMVWEGIATFKANAQTSAPGGNYLNTQENKAKWIAYGLYVASSRGQYPRCQGVCLGTDGTHWDLAGAAYEAYQQVAGGSRGASTFTPTVVRVLTAWNAMDAGTNEPLAQPTMTDRSGNVVSEWNYNLDGFAHYGLLPDFVQDAKNVGLTSNDLAPLFRGAEDYIEMWERIESHKLRIPTP